MEGSLTKLEAENRALKAQLALANERLERYNTIRKLDSIKEGFSALDGNMLHFSVNRPDYAFPLTRIQAKTLAADTINRCTAVVDAGHLDGTEGVAPPQLELERYVSSPF